MKNQYRLWKKSVSMVLGLVVMLFLIPMTVRAQEDVASVTDGSGTTPYTSIAEAFAAANASPGSTLKLLTNVDTDTTLEVSGNFMLDLNGKNLTGYKDGGSISTWAIKVVSTGTLEVTDSSAEGTGAVSNYSGTINNLGTLIVSGGEFSGTVKNTGTMNMQGGSVDGVAVAPSYNLTNGIETSGTLTFSGGYVSGHYAIRQTAGTVEISGGSIFGVVGLCVDGGTAFVTGGRIDGNTQTLQAWGTGKINVTGGNLHSYFSAQIFRRESGQIKISGTRESVVTCTYGFGSFVSTSQPSLNQKLSSFVTSGNALYLNGVEQDPSVLNEYSIGKDIERSTVLVGPPGLRASVNSNGTLSYYFTVEDALGAANSGDVVTVMDSTSMNAEAEIKSGVTLDVNGKTLTVADGSVLYNDGTIVLNDGQIIGKVICRANNHVGGTAVCQQGTICSLCGQAYGSVPAHSYVNGFCQNPGAGGTVCDAYEPAADSDNDGYYEIDNTGKLYWFAEQVNGGQYGLNAKLTADITVNPGSFDAAGTYTAQGTESVRSWIRIGTTQVTYYQGTFDGQGHTVSGLYLASESENYVGLFGVAKGTVKNVHLTNTYFKGNESVGGIVGYQFDNSSVTACSFHGMVTGSANIGGIIGYNCGDISYCYNSGTIYGISCAGGVSGCSMWQGSIRNSYNMGTITGTTAASAYIGSLIGRNGGTVTDCYYQENTAKDGTGIVQYGYGAETSGTAYTDRAGVAGKSADAFQSGEVTWLLNKEAGSESSVWRQTLGSMDYPGYTGGIVYYGYDDCTDTTAEYKNIPLAEKQGHTLERHGYVAATCTEDGNNTYFECIVCGKLYADRDAATETTLENLKIPAWGHSPKTAATCNTKAICGKCGQPYGEEPVGHTYDDDGFCINKPDGSKLCDAYEPAADSDEDSYYEIDNAGKLFWFGAQVNDGAVNLNAELTDHIVLNGDRWWKSIGTEDNGYVGTFNGDGHIISGMTVHAANSKAGGLFGYVAAGGMVQKVGLSGIYVNAKNYSGGVAGSNSGTIRDCYVSDGTLIMVTNSLRGGIAGQNLGSVSGCWAYMAVTGDGGTVTDSYYKATSENAAGGKTAAQFASGEVTWLLNGGVADGTQAWYQTCGTGVPAFTGDTVYYGYASCDAAEKQYSNTWLSEVSGHIWQYEKAGEDNIRVTCSRGCQFMGAASFTVKVEQPAALTYDGASKTAKAVMEPDVTEFTVPDIVYTGNLTEGVPVNAGVYTASLTLGDVTAQIGYTVERADVTVDMFRFEAPLQKEYSGEPKAAVLQKQKDEVGIFTVKYFDSNNEPVSGTPVNAGTYVVKIDVEETENYNSVQNLTDSAWSYVIEPKELELAVEGISEHTYTGKQIKPAITVKDGNVTLKEGIDYELSYGENINVVRTGDSTNQPTYGGTVAVALMGNYRNVSNVPQSVSFIISPADPDWVVFPKRLTADYGDDYDDVLLPSAVFGAFHIVDEGSALNPLTETVKVCFRPSDDNNYNHIEKEVPITVSRAVITPYVTGVVEKVYDGKRSVEKTVGTVLPSMQLSGILFADEVKVDVVFNFDDTKVGTGKTVTVSDITLSGAQADYYMLSTTQLTTKGTIRPATISILETRVSDKIYDGTTDVKDITCVYSAPFGKDEAVVETTAVYETAGSGINKKVYVTYKLTGGDACNYVLSKTSETLTADILSEDVFEVIAQIRDLTEENVTSDHVDIIKEVREKIDDMLKDEGLDETRCQLLEDAREETKDLLKRVEDAADAANTKSVKKSKNTVKENVKLKDEDNLTQAVKDLEAALENYSGNYTKEERAQIDALLEQLKDAQQVLREALELIEAVEALPDKVTPRQEELADKVLALEDDYEAFGEHEKSLVPNKIVKKLKKLAAQAVDYSILEGNGAVWKKGSGELNVKADGPLNKFVKLIIDDKTVNADSFKAVSGSTVITIKADYLENLAAEKHSISIVYTDGIAEGAFEVADAEEPSYQPEEPSDQPGNSGAQTEDSADNSQTQALPVTDGNSDSIAEGEAAENSGNQTDKTEVPHTSDSARVTSWCTLLCISGFVLVLLMRLNRKNTVK